jgi:nucleoside-diphosphate-sugar epimerase
MRIAVVGATGNVGVALLRACASRPEIEHVVGIARRPPAGASPDSFGGKVSWVAADVAVDDVFGPLRGADAVVNLAWQIQPVRGPGQQGQLGQRGPHGQRGQGQRGQLHLTNVHGSKRVFDAALAAGVGAVVHASSVGAYAPGPKDTAVDESWPHTGIASSSYSRDKATVEAMLDRLEAAHPSMRVVRMRPALIFQRDAGSEIARYFLGPLVPRSLVKPRRLPVLALPEQLRFQAVHTADVADAYLAALTRDVQGAFNLAADPVLDARRLAEMFDARVVHIPAAMLRALADVTYRLRLQPTDAGWVDMGLRTPLMDSTRARELLDWRPRMSADAALLDLTEGIQAKAAGPTPALR